MMAPLSGFDYLHAVLEKQRGSNPDPGGQAAGWAAVLEEGGLYVLGSDEGEALLCPQNEMTGDIKAVAGDDRRPSRQDIVPVASRQIRGCSRGCKAAELFGTDRYPRPARKVSHAGGGVSQPAVEPGTESGETGADQANFRTCR